MMDASARIDRIAYKQATTLKGAATRDNNVKTLIWEELPWLISYARELESRIATLEAAGNAAEQERDAVDRALRSLFGLVDGVSNGYCKLCGSHRVCDTAGNPQPCENEYCISRIAQAALAPAPEGTG